MTIQRKKNRACRTGEKSDFFDGLPDDLVVCILSKLTASASSPSDFVSILATCKRLNRLGLHPLVLSKASSKVFEIRAKSWSESTHRFLKQCVSAGNAEACFTLGMIRFYCLENRGSGASLMAKAAMKSHAPALYALAVIQFNGSGGAKGDKDLRAGVALCARAAFLGHVDALRELGHCLQDGYGVRRNLAEGRRLLIRANALELAACLRRLTWHLPGARASPLLSDFGCSVSVEEARPANRFLKEWFGAGWAGLGRGLRMCSHDGCGRPETRAHEFRRCSVCGKANYCSRGCQALDWKARHKAECVAGEERWFDGGDGGGEVAAAAEEDEDGNNMI